MRDLDVVVVGAGIGGLTTAIALQRTGHRVRVVDQVRELRPEGAGISLWSNGVKVLDALGPRCGGRRRRRAHGPAGLPRQGRGDALRLQPRAALRAGGRAPVPRAPRRPPGPAARRGRRRAWSAPGRAAPASRTDATRRSSSWRAASGSRATSSSPPTAPTRGCASGSSARRPSGPTSATTTGTGWWPTSWPSAIPARGRCTSATADGSRRCRCATPSTSSSTSRSPTPTLTDRGPQETLKEHFDGWNPIVQRLIDGLDPTVVANVSIHSHDPLDRFARGPRRAARRQRPHRRARPRPGWVHGDGGRARPRRVPEPPPASACADALARYSAERVPRAADLVRRATNRARTLPCPRPGRHRGLVRRAGRDDGSDIIDGICKSILTGPCH